MGVSNLNQVTLTFSDKSGVDRLISLMRNDDELRLPGYNPMLYDHSIEEVAEMNEWFQGLTADNKYFMFRVPKGTTCDSILDALDLWTPPVDSYKVSYDGRVIQIETLYGSFDLKRWGLQDDSTFLGGSSYVSDLQDVDGENTYGTFTPDDLNDTEWNNLVQGRLQRDDLNKGAFRSTIKRNLVRKTEDHARSLLFATA